MCHAVSSMFSKKARYNHMQTIHLNQEIGFIQKLTINYAEMKFDFLNWLEVKESKAVEVAKICLTFNPGIFLTIIFLLIDTLTEYDG